MRQWLIKLALSKILRVTVPEDIITQDKRTKKIYLGGVEVTDMEKRSLIAEAKAIANMRLWSVINETIKQRSYEKGWRDSTQMEHLNTAKIEYHVLDTQNSIVKIFRDMVK